MKTAPNLKFFAVGLIGNTSTYLRWLFGWLCLVVLALVLRIYPGQDHFAWIYDQARDSYVIESIVAQKNIVLVGPQTDYPGLNHGPASYYFLAPFYYLSGGDPNLAGLAMIVLNLSTMIPLALLVQSMFRRRWLTTLTLFVFACSYEQIEYARWIFNFPVSVPALVWSYYFLWRTWFGEGESRWWPLLAGLALGVAIQGELFLLYLLPFVGLGFYWYGQSLWRGMVWVVGVLLGLAPLLVAEVKFGFLGTRTFVGTLMAHQADVELLTSQMVGHYLDHVSVTLKHTLFGMTYPMALWLGVMCLLFGYWIWQQLESSHERKMVSLVTALFFSHSVLFVFEPPLQVFLNVALAVPALILFAWLCERLWSKGKKLFAVGLLAVFLVSNGWNLYHNVREQTPFGLFNFIQDGVLFSQKVELVDAMYELSGGEQFSLSVLGTPYGVRTVWASVFRQYERRTGKPLPVWTGYRANGYPGEMLFPTSDHFLPKHIVVIESSQHLLPDPVKAEFMADQNARSTLVSEVQRHGYILQLRQPLQQLEVTR